MGFISKLFHLGEKRQPGRRGQQAPRRPAEPVQTIGRLVCFLFLIDNSGSMRETDFPPSRIQAACRAFLKAVEYLARHAPHSMVGMGTFSDTFRSLVSLAEVKGNVANINSAVQNLGRPGWTNMGKGFRGIAKMARECPEDSQVVVVALTDGHDTGRIDPLPIATDLKDQGTDIWTLGIGGDRSEVDETLLIHLASAPSQYRFIGDWEGPQALIDTFEDVVAGVYSINHSDR